MGTRKLTLEHWIEVLKDIRFKDFKMDDQYIVPIVEGTWYDFKDELYPEGLTKEVGYWDDYGGGLKEVAVDLDSEDEDFDVQEDLKLNVLPELKNLIKGYNNAANGGFNGKQFFYVESYPKEGMDIAIFLTFEDEDIPLLQERGILPKDMVTSSQKSFSEFEGPLFERATVSFDTEEALDGRTLPVPSTAKLHLPDITEKESQTVSPNFLIRVKKSYEDNKAVVRTYQFTFNVYEISFAPLPNGLVRPKFKAELKEYKNV